MFSVYGTADGDYIISVSSKTEWKQKIQNIHVVFFFTNEINVRLTDVWCTLFRKQSVIRNISYIVSIQRDNISNYVFVKEEKENKQYSIQSNHNTSRITINTNSNTNRIYICIFFHRLLNWALSIPDVFFKKK